MGLSSNRSLETSAIQGVRRFLDRVHGLALRDLSANRWQMKLLRLVHRTVKKVGEDIEALHFTQPSAA